MTARIIHPEFFPHDGLWRTKDPEVSAESLRELKAKLGRRFRIKGYYPQGFRTPLWPEEPKRTYMPPRMSSRQFYKASRPVSEPLLDTEEKPTLPLDTPLELPKEKYLFQKQTKYDAEAVLDLWAKGHTGPAIGRLLGLHSSTTAAQIVGRYRANGDVRAHRRDKKKWGEV